MSDTGGEKVFQQREPGVLGGSMHMRYISWNDTAGTQRGGEICGVVKDILKHSFNPYVTALE